MKVRAYACSVPILGDHEEIVNGESASKVRYRYLLDVREAYQELTFKHIRVRLVGPPVTTERFLHNAKYRGIPGVRCGDRVTMRGGKEHGIVVGHNSSANLDILFEDGPHAGQVMNVHPAGVDGWHDRVARAMGEAPK